MANQHQEIIKICIDELEVNNIALNNLSKDLLRKNLIGEYDISDLLSSLRSSIEKLDSRLIDSRDISDYKELLDLLWQVRDGIHQSRDSFDRRMRDCDRLLSQVLERNHRVFVELVKIRDEDSYF